MSDWRQQQLAWFEEPAVIKQDHDLLEKIKQVNPRAILFKGQADYFQKLLGTKDGPYDFCVYIVNQSFNFNSLRQKLIKSSARSSVMPDFWGSEAILTCTKYFKNLLIFFSAIDNFKAKI